MTRRDVANVLSEDDEERWRDLHEQPLDELSDAEVTSKIRLSIKRRFDYPEWVVIFEYGAPGQNGSVCDCIAVNTLPSRNYKVVAFEFKASRSDWLREVRDGQKNDYFVQLADEFYVVAPKGVVEDSEIPDGWGYFELKPNSEQLYKIDDSELTEHQQGEPPRRFWARFLDHTIKDDSSYDAHDLREARSRGYEEAKDEGVSDLQSDRKLEKLRRKAGNWDDLQNSELGFLPSYTFDEDDIASLEAAWNLVRMVNNDSFGSLSGDLEHLKSDIQRKHDSMMQSAEDLEATLDSLQEHVDNAGNIPTQPVETDGGEGGEQTDG